MRHGWVTQRLTQRHRTRDVSQRGRDGCRIRVTTDQSEGIGEVKGDARFAAVTQVMTDSVPNDMLVFGARQRHPRRLSESKGIN